MHIYFGYKGFCPPAGNDSRRRIIPILHYPDIHNMEFFRLEQPSISGCMDESQNYLGLHKSAVQSSPLWPPPQV